jgi:tetraacyldisaccharide-1-P 4'-kinase
MAHLYSNENFPFPTVQALRRLGHDVLTIQETGRDNQEFSDEEVVAFATLHERAVLTINRKDFIRLHRQVSNHQGIIVCTLDPNFERQAQRIHAAIELQSSLEGLLLKVNRPNIND